MKKFLLSFCLPLLILASCNDNTSSDDKTSDTTPEIEYGGDISVPKTYVNPAGKKFPILGWFSLWGDGLTFAKYLEMADAGFNLSYSQLGTLTECQTALKAAKGTGVKIIARFKDEQDTYLARNVKKLRSDPTLAGYFLCDEPAASQFDALKKQVDIVRELDDTHMIYINLFPNYAPSSVYPDGGDYSSYVKASIDQLQLGYVSFDFYPVTMDDNGVQTTAAFEKSYFSNLEVVRDLCNKNSIPFWGFALSTSNSTYPTPTLSSLRYQIYHNLAYGAQGIQYFTYVLVPGGEFKRGPLTYDPFNKTEIYDYVKTVNSAVIALTPYFLDNKVVAVGSTGTLPSWRCKSFDEVKPSNIQSVTSDGRGLTCSYFTKDNKDYLFIVNQDINNTQNVKVSFLTEASAISEANKLTPVGKSVEAVIEAGGMLLYQF